MKMLSAILLSLAALSAHAQPVAFKGFQLGAPKDELLQRFSGLTCRPVPQQYRMLGDETCDAMGINISPDLKSYGGQEIWDMSFAIVGGRVEAFSGKIRPATYEAIRDAMAQGLGAGTETSQSMVSRGGANFQSREWTHVGSNGTFTIREHSTRIDQGSVSGETSAMQAFRQQFVDPKKGSKDL